MNNLEFYFVLSFPFLFSFLFFPNFKKINYKFIGALGAFSFVLIWLNVFQGSLSGTVPFNFSLRPSFWNILSFDFLIQGKNIPFIFINLTLVLFNYFWFWKTRIVQEKFYNIILFFILFTTNAALISNNLFFFLCLSEMTFLLFSLMLRTYGHKLKEGDFFKIVVYNFISFLFIIIPVIFICFKGQNYFGDYNTNYGYLKMVLTEIKKENDSVLYFLIFSMSSGVLIKCLIFPFHEWSLSSFLKSPKELTLPLFGLIVNLGFYSLDKYILPLSDILSPTFRLVMIFIFCFGIAYNCFELLQNKEKKINVFILRLFFIHLNFCGMGFFSMKMGSQSNLLIYLILNFLTFFTLLSFISKNSILGPFKSMYRPQLSIDKKIKNTIFLFLMFSYVGAPFFGFFNSEFVIIYELFKMNTYLGLIIVLLMIIPMIKCLEDLFISRIDNGENSNLHLDLFNFKLLPVMALLVMNLIMGFNPNLVFDFFKMRLF